MRVFILLSDFHLSHLQLCLVGHCSELVHPVAVDIDEKVPGNQRPNSHVIENDENNAGILRRNQRVVHYVRSSSVKSIRDTTDVMSLYNTRNKQMKIHIPVMCPTVTRYLIIRDEASDLAVT